MDNCKTGKSTILFRNPPVIKSWASVVGKKEAEGPLKHTFDVVEEDSFFGEKTWEQAECRMQQIALQTLLNKSGLSHHDLDLLFSGDLLNQCISSSFTVKNMNIPHLGLYGACSTMAESLALAAIVVGGGFCKNVVAMTSSHFASSERQFRFPLGYGGQRTPTAQWTVTGAGAALITSWGSGPCITGCTIGSIVDLGIKDANNMGAAMAPAALSTIRQHFEDTATTDKDYDLIVTGDLGQHGKDLLLALAHRVDIHLGGKLTDCGNLIFDNTQQDVHCGGSGCGCSAATLCGYLLGQLQKGKLKKILFCGTGALLSPTSVQQGLSIPGVCHAISISGGRQ